MEYKIIKVYEDSEDYNYENLFLVRINEEQYNELLQIIEEFDNLDWEERKEKFGYESKIEFVETYIMKNFEVVKADLIGIDCW